MLTFQQNISTIMNYLLAFSILCRILKVTKSLAVILRPDSAVFLYTQLIKTRDTDIREDRGDTSDRCQISGYYFFDKITGGHIMPKHTKPKPGKPPQAWQILYKIVEQKIVLDRFMESLIALCDLDQPIMIDDLCALELALHGYHDRVRELISQLPEDAQ